MIEKCSAPVVCGNMAISGKDFAAIPSARRIHLGNLVIGEIVEEIHRGAADRLADASAIAVVYVRDICPHLNDAVLGVIGEAVAGVVVQQIACGVVAVAVHSVVAAAESGHKTERTVLLPAVAITIVFVGVRRYWFGTAD